MNVNLQQFTRTWPSVTVGTAEGDEGEDDMEEEGEDDMEEEDELGGKLLLKHLECHN